MTASRHTADARETAAERLSRRLPTLTTPRLILRPFDPAADLEPLARIARDADTMRYLAHGRPWTHQESVEMIGRHVAQYGHGLGFGAVLDKATGEFAGWAGVQNPKRWPKMMVDLELPCDVIEVGWTLAPPWRGRGYATEAARAWLGYGFASLGLEEIIAVHDVPNVASERVMDRLGMTRRHTFSLTDGSRMCLHATDRHAWRTTAAADGPAQRLR